MIAVTPKVPTDPVSASPEIQIFESEYWDLVTGPKRHPSVDMWVEPGNLLVVTTHRWWDDSPPVARSAPTQSG